jgi:hypothetical protein
VVQRRRLEIADRRISGSVQPYHAAEQMKLSEAEAFLAERRESSCTLARKAIQEAVAELLAKDVSIAGCCVLAASGRPTGDLAKTLASHALIHTAEGDFFRAALRTACESCGLTVSVPKEKQVANDAAERLRMPPAELERRICELGKSVGPPWRQDEKLCSMAAWSLLVSVQPQPSRESPRSAAGD